MQAKVSELVSDKIKTLKLTVTIAANADLGERNLFVETPAGMSNGFHFFVGQLPEVNEVEPNDDFAAAQTLPALPVLVNGQINRQVNGQPVADKDFFRFEAKAGQTLVFTVDARAILPYIADAVPGWLQAVLTLYDANGKELAYADGFRFKQDTVLIYKVTADGQYVLEIRDSLYRGREDFIYRLSIGALPYITDIYPLGGKRGSSMAVQLHGVNLQASYKGSGPIDRNGPEGASHQLDPTPYTTLNVNVPARAPQVLWLQTTGQGLASNRVKFDAGDLPETSEIEPNDSPQQANRVNIGSIINGRIDRPGDLDYFVFKAAAKQDLVFEVRARRLDSSLDSVIALFDSQGKKLAQNDDVENANEPPLTHQADSRLEFKIPTDGDYFLRIGDAQRKGGEDYAYRLIIAPDRPDFDLRLASEFPQRLAAGETAAATVSAIRRVGYNGEIRLALKDVPKGFVLRGGVISQKRGWEDGNETRLTITAPADAVGGILTPQIVATAQIAGQEVVRPLVPTVTVKQAFSINHLVPVPEFHLNIAARQPGFVLATDVPADGILEVAPGGEAKIPLKAVRNAGAGAAIALVLDQPPWGFSAAGGQIEAGKNDCTLAVKVDKGAHPGRVQSVVFSGTMDTGKEKLVRYAPAVLIKVAAPGRLPWPRLRRPQQSQSRPPSNRRRPPRRQPRSRRR